MISPKKLYCYNNVAYPTYLSYLPACPRYGFATEHLQQRKALHLKVGEWGAGRVLLCVRIGRRAAREP